MGEHGVNIGCLGFRPHLQVTVAYHILHAFVHKWENLVHLLLEQNAWSGYIVAFVRYVYQLEVHSDQSECVKLSVA